MVLGIILGLFGLGAALVLLFTLAVYAVPFFVGLSIGLFAFETGAGVLGALLVGLVAGVITLFAAQMLFASLRSPALRLALALLFAVPAAIAGYSSVFGISAVLVSSEIWRHVFAIVAGLIVGAVAAMRLAVIAEPPAGPQHGTVRRALAGGELEPEPAHHRMPPLSIPRV